MSRQQNNSINHDEFTSAINEAPPQVIPDPKIVNSRIVKELNEMSVNERNNAYEDLHGVADPIIEETEEFVAKCLNETQFELSRIHNKKAYELALSQSREYAGGKDLFLMFLRGNNFDPKQAALQIVTHFEFKKLYFGDELLGRPILFTDLNADDLTAIESGWIQGLPFRDKSGRSVIFSMAQFMPKVKAINIVRAMWYQTMSFLEEEEEAQKRGFVLVATCDRNVELTRDMIEASWHTSRSQQFFPFRKVASHFCGNNTGVAMQLVSLVNDSWNKGERARCRVHYGTQTEWMYALMTFGIPVEHIPITSGGQLKNKFHREYLACRLNIDQEKKNIKNLGLTTLKKDKSKIRLMQPLQTDVLIGSGAVVQQHSGNKHFNCIVDEHRERYQKEQSRKKKMVIVDEIFAIFKAERIRFLEKSNENKIFWFTITDENEITKRIMKRLRSKGPNAYVADKRKGNNDKGKTNNNIDKDCQEEDSPSSSPFLNQTGEIDLSDACCNCVCNRNNKRQRT